MTTPQPSMFKMRRPLHAIPHRAAQWVSVLALLALVACNSATEEEGLEAYNKKLGGQGELTKTHLIIHWPARSFKVDPGPVTLKIPRGYLQDPPLRKDDDGSLRWLYLQFALPDVTAWKQMPSVYKGDPQEKEKMVALLAHRERRVSVFLDHDGGGGHLIREAVRERGQDKERFWPDGEVAGLERYTSLECFTPGMPDDPVFQKYLHEKPPEDTSPANCRMSRRDMILVSPTEVTSDNEGVAITCSSTGCYARFQAGKRGAEVPLTQEQLPQWRERIEPARKLVNSFIVPETETPTTASGVRQKP